MPNIEMKSRYADLSKAQAIAKSLEGKFLWKDTQIDTYFTTAHGKLKLRETQKNGAELLPYVKVDQGELKRSDYAKIPISDPKLVKHLFDQLLGTRLVVKKEREVYLVGNVRVHLDNVDQLGSFLEFEAVFENDSPETVAQERRKVQELMEKFRVKKEDLIDGSYPELLSTPSAPG